VRIFPKAVDQAKKTTLKGALFCQMLQRKEVLSQGTRPL
jgi:hypothetical protein